MSILVSVAVPARGIRQHLTYISLSQRDNSKHLWLPFEKVGTFHSLVVGDTESYGYSSPILL